MTVTLPRPGQRWTPMRKCAVCEAVRLGEISRGEARERYGLTDEEFGHWLAAYDRFGRPGVAINARRRIPETRHLQEHL